MNAEMLLKHFDRISEAPDAIPRLRQFILDLAVRGKLVEQDPDDEPAAALLNRIQGEKACRAKAEKENALCGTGNQMPFTVPLGWEWVTVEDICIKTGSGSTPRGGKDAYVSSGVPFFRSQNVYNDGIRLDGIAYISEETHERMKGTAIEPGDLLLNITGGSIGRCARVPDDICAGNISQHVAILRLFIKEVAPFTHFVVKSPFFQNQIIGSQTGAGREGLPKNRMDRILIPLPPLPEQHRIVARLNQLETLCDQLEAARNECELKRERLVASSLHRIGRAATNGKSDGEAEPAVPMADAIRFHLDHLPLLTMSPEHITELRKTILNLAVSGRLVSKDIELKVGSDAPFPIPISWEWVSVGQVAESRLGKMLDRTKNRGIPRPYLRNVNVRWFNFDLSDVYEMPFEDHELDEFSLDCGDVLICEGGEPGRAAVWDKRQAYIYFQKAIHRVRFHKKVNPHFFVYALWESAQSGRLSSYFTGVGIKHFTGKGLASFAFPLPPLDEQLRLVDKINELMALCDQLEAQLTSTESDTRRLLQVVLRDALAPASQPAGRKRTADIV